MFLGSTELGFLSRYRNIHEDIDHTNWNLKQSMSHCHTESTDLLLATKNARRHTLEVVMYVHRIVIDKSILLCTKNTTLHLHMKRSQVSRMNSCRHCPMNRILQGILAGVGMVHNTFLEDTEDSNSNFG